MLRKDLLDTIRSVHAGKKKIPPEIASEIAEHHTDDALTQREIEVCGKLRRRSQQNSAVAIGNFGRNC